MIYAQRYEITLNSNRTAIINRIPDRPKVSCYCEPLITHSQWNNIMVTSSNGNIFSASLVLCAGNSPVTDEFSSQRSVTRSFDVFFDLWNGWVNNCEAGDLRRHRAHYDVTVPLLLNNKTGMCNFSTTSLYNKSVEIPYTTLTRISCGFNWQ